MYIPLYTVSRYEIGEIASDMSAKLHDACLRLPLMFFASSGHKCCVKLMPFFISSRHTLMHLLLLYKMTLPPEVDVVQVISRCDAGHRISIA